MNNYKRVVIILIISILSVILTIFTSNKSGFQIQQLESKIYQKISGKTPQHIQYDSAGVPLVAYEGKIGTRYNPVTIAEKAISLSSENDSMSQARFHSCIKWLTDNCKDLNDSSIIFFDYFDWPGYKMTSPWRSAMNQGRAMQAFLKAFDNKEDTTFLKMARKSMNTLFTEVKDGGVTYKDSLGYWYEEYADDNVPQSRVLNGMIVVLQALSDFYKVTDEPESLFLFNEGVEAVKSNLPLYDNNGHSNYDIQGKPASPWYHKFHIELLGFLYNETQEPKFNEYRVKWQQFKEPSYLAGLFKKPTRIGIFTVFTIFAGIFVLLFALFYIFRFRSINN